MKRYSDLNTELKRTFGTKVFKLSLNGGFSCPNRSNSPGCAFCGDKGSGDFAAPPELGIMDQIRQQIAFQSKKWKSGGYIAYFGAFTSTYADIETLEKIYDEALSQEGVLGLAIATRPDCISDDVLMLLEGYNKKTYLWIELGFQTVHDETHRSLNTGYTKSIFYETYMKLKEKNIRVVPHLIFGLPGETRDMMLESVRYVASLKPWGIKLHMLYILNHSVLYKMYADQPFKILDPAEYVSLVADSLEIMESGILIHRLTGDPPRRDVYLPLWSIDKRAVIQAIDKELLDRDSFQGKYFMKG